MIVAEALEAHDELEQAHETFTEGARLLLTDGEEPPYATHPLLFGRHRVRRMLGADHDAWDTLADGLSTGPVPLDELHDPGRVWSLGSDNPAELRAEISRLRAELGTYREALSRPFPVAVLHWPKQELTELTDAYPSLTAEYPSHEAHLATIESSLRELATSGTPNLGIVTGTVPSYEAFAASEGTTPADTTLLPQYATTLAARGRAVAWPPQRGRRAGAGRGRLTGSATARNPDRPGRGGSAKRLNKQAGDSPPAAAGAPRAKTHPPFALVCPHSRRRAPQPRPTPRPTPGRTPGPPLPPGRPLASPRAGAARVKGGPQGHRRSRRAAPLMRGAEARH